jgi:hypothetical protein
MGSRFKRVRKFYWALVYLVLQLADPSSAPSVGDWGEYGWHQDGPASVEVKKVKAADSVIPLLSDLGKQQSKS